MPDAPTPTETQSQAQTQSQQQAITISVQSAGDPELERRIFGQVHSAGRQLRNIAAVVEVLLAAHAARDPGFADGADARAAVDAFTKMQLDILRAKAPRDPDRVIRELEALRRADPAAFGDLRDRLNAWLKDK
jgi:hypothetical protein